MDEQCLKLYYMTKSMWTSARQTSHSKIMGINILFYLFILPLFNQVGKLRTSSHLQLRPGQDKAKQFDRYNNTELHME